MKRPHECEAGEPQAPYSPPSRRSLHTYCILPFIAVVEWRHGTHIARGNILHRRDDGILKLRAKRCLYCEHAAFSKGYSRRGREGTISEARAEGDPRRMAWACASVTPCIFNDRRRPRPRVALPSHHQGGQVSASVCPKAHSV